jgi:flavin reductase (DIM6/NTAB) family NADH-FMN oxidoreductase RutF
MDFDFAALAPTDRAKLINATIVPRPIAWLLSVDEAGTLNAAPFSYFNAFSATPPMVCVGVGSRPAGGPKDSAVNIHANKQFVVNLVSFETRRLMNVCAADFDAGISEIERAGLSTAPSAKVAPPRIAESPVAYECELAHSIDLGDHRFIIVGRVVSLYIRDDMMLNAEKHYVDTPKLDLIGRMHGRGWYVRTTDLFEMARVSVEEVEAAAE